MGEKVVRKEHRIINGIESRHCASCDTWLPLDVFSKNKSRWDGIQDTCTPCRKIYNSLNSAKIIARSKEWKLNNLEQYKETHRKYYQSHKQEAYEQSKARRLANPEKMKAYKKKFFEKNPEKATEYRLRAIEKNPDARKIAYTKSNKRIRSTLKGRLCCNISSNLYQSLKNGKGGVKWEKILGYSYAQLKQQLEKSMPENYSWDDYMSGKLHMDHKIPIAAFNFETTEHIDFKRCWDLNNLQLLPAIDNIKKGAKVEKPFQPSLLF